MDRYGKYSSVLLLLAILEILGQVFYSSSSSSWAFILFFSNDKQMEILMVFLLSD